MNDATREEDQQLQHKSGESKCSSDLRVEHFPQCALFFNIYFNFLLITTAHFVQHIEKKY